LGDPAEALTAVANSYLQNGSCPAVAAHPTLLSVRTNLLPIISRLNNVAPEPGERRGMSAD
jgi:hypothetical protein